MDTFWQTLKKPIYALAPMADVTDPAYRALIASIGPADVMWTEFVSADGIFHTREKKQYEDAGNPLLRDLQFSENEQPIVAQLFGSNPEHMAYAAKYCAQQGFSGIDINMGCPDRAIERQGCGSGMIRTPDVAKTIYEAAATSGLPVSIKTRIGYSTEEIDTWIRFVLELQPAALTVHLRTRSEMSKVPAHWEYMPRIAALKNSISPQTVLLGNGDVETLAQAEALVKETGCDGVMFGRAIFGNPWLFTGRTLEEVSPTERLHALDELCHNFSLLIPAKSVHILKKHIKAFIVGFPDAPLLRSQLMDATTVAELRAALKAHALY